MSQNNYIKCLECGTVNNNTDYCSNCGAIINVTLKRKLDREKRAADKKAHTETKTTTKVDSFFDRAKNHPNVIVRGAARALYSVWWIVMIVGGVLAYVLGIIAS